MPGESGLAEFRLPRGRHGLAPELVAENQRWRLIGASSEVLATSGLESVTSSAVVAWAGVSKGTFYEHFENVEQCLLTAHEMAADCVLELATDSCEAEGRGRLDATLRAILGFLAAEPSLAHLLGASPAAADPAIAASRERLVLRLAELLRGQPGAPAHVLPPVAECHVVGGSLAFLSDQLAQRGARRLPELAPELAEFLSVPCPRASPT